MCTHHMPGEWTRRWDLFAMTTLATFGILEGYALATVGQDGTLSAYIRRLAGIEARCRHSHFGRAAIFAGFGWGIAHLGWGVLGWAPKR